MSYQTGTATGPDDLLDKLRVFLLAEGWSVNDHSVDGGGYRLHVQKTLGGEASYFNLRSAINENIFGNSSYPSGLDGHVTGLGINGSTGYSGALAWHAQSGGTVDINYPTKTCGSVLHMMSTSAIPAYYFFTVGNTVNVVVEMTSGKVQSMSFGMIEKQGVFTGGQFFSAPYASSNCYSLYMNATDDYSGSKISFAYKCERPNTFLYFDADDTASWKSNYDNYNSSLLCPCPSHQYYADRYSFQGLLAMFHVKSPNYYNSISSMAPVYLLGKRSDNNFSLLGWPEGIRYLNTQNYSMGQELTYGTETWKIFEMNGYGYTAKYYRYGGFAFLKEV